jgi:hypothetical protein
MLREPQRTLEVERVAKQVLPMPERDLPGVVSVQVEQIEEIEPHPNPAEKLCRWVLNLHALLKLPEARNPVFERHDFTVCDEGICRFHIKCRHDLRILLIQPLAIPRIEQQVLGVAEHKAALTVQLRLKQPAFS